MARKSSDGPVEIRSLGFPVTLLIVHCGHCGRLSCFAVDGAWLAVGGRHLFVRGTGESRLPKLACRACNGTEVSVLEDLR